jgi:hypothetical protein
LLHGCCTAAIAGIGTRFGVIAIRATAWRLSLANLARGLPRTSDFRRSEEFAAEVSIWHIRLLPRAWKCGGVVQCGGAGLLQGSGLSHASQKMCRSAEAPEPEVAYRGRFEAALHCQSSAARPLIVPRKRCAVRRMRVGLAPPIVAMRPGGPLCADKVLFPFSSQ